MNRYISLPLAGLVMLSAIAGKVWANENQQSLGRVFLSPAERTALNKKRSDHYQASKQEPEKQQPVADLPQPEVDPEPDAIFESPPVLINGFVRRHGTSGTVWINGESSYDGDLAASNIDHLQTKIVGRQVRVVPLNMPEAGEEPVFLKPGQHYDPNEHRVTDAFRAPSGQAVEEE